MMLDNIKDFFDRFVDDFPTFDGDIIASRYFAPYIAVSSDGDVWQCNEPTDVVVYFQGLLDRHKSQGVLYCKYKDLEYAPVGKNCYFATVTWSMVGAEDRVISTWRESYNLISTDSGIKILTSIDH